MKLHPQTNATLTRLARRFRYAPRRLAKPSNDQGYWATLSDALFDQSIHIVE